MNMKNTVGRMARWIREPVFRFLHDTALKRKLHAVLFESGTRAGRRFENILLTTIGGMVFATMLESVRSLPHAVTLVLEVLEYLSFSPSPPSTSRVSTARPAPYATYSVSSASSTCLRPCRST